MTKHFIRWNISRRAKVFHDRETFIVSIPKSGRTWLRVFLNAYYNTLYGLAQEVNHMDQYEDARPRYLFTHDRYEHLTISSPKQRLQGRYLIPGKKRRQSKILLLSRDPRDVMVSLYFQNTRRVKEEERFRGSISEMIRDRRFGTDRVVDTMNSWMQEWRSLGDRFLLSRYEEWHLNTRDSFRRIIGFMDSLPVDEAALDKAIEFSDFSNMQKREKATDDGASALKPGDPSDPESFKARRGKVAGYADYLTADDIAYINERLRRLHRDFDYSS